MPENETTQFKLTLGALRLEYAGREGFLKSDVLALVKAVDRLQASRLIVPFTTLQMAIEEALTTQGAAEDVIVSTKNDLDAMSELGETESLRLQMAMDRLSKMMTTLSNILKKMSDTAESITGNLK
jgi:hypothetical protein